MRWRKGFPASQMVALWNEGWAHGSFDVGMLRDSRAVACLGSSVEVEDEDGFGFGDEVGDADGGCVIEVTMVEENRSKRMRTIGLMFQCLIKNST